MQSLSFCDSFVIILLLSQFVNSFFDFSFQKITFRHPKHYSTKSRIVFCAKCTLSYALHFLAVLQRGHFIDFIKSSGEIELIAKAEIVADISQGIIRINKPSYCLHKHKVVDILPYRHPEFIFKMRPELPFRNLAALRNDLSCQLQRKVVLYISFRRSQNRRMFFSVSDIQFKLVFFGNSRNCPEKFALECKI